MKGNTLGIWQPRYEILQNIIEIGWIVVEILQDSDAILFMTDHDAFTSLDFVKIKAEMKTPLVIDGRNFFNEEKLNSLGFYYKAIGKPQKLIFNNL